MLIFWAIVFLVSLAVLIKGSGYLLTAAEKIGLALGLTPFVIGVLIVGFGTSLPELAASIAGVLAGATELVAANVIGSNIANILLIAGFAALAGKRLAVQKDLVDLDIPLLAIATTFLLVVAYDGSISRTESLALLLAFAVYLAYAWFHNDGSERGQKDVKEFEEARGATSSLTARDFFLLILGFVMLIGGAKYLVDSVLALSSIVGIGVGVISLVAVAVGTSMPELVVAIRAGLMGKSDVSLGNIFGSNIFNALIVIGVPGLIAPLVVDAQSLTVGLPVMVGATILFLISTLSNRFHNYEGALYLLLYALFLGKVTGFI